MSNEKRQDSNHYRGTRPPGRNAAINLARLGVDLISAYHSNLSEAQSLIREAEALGRNAAAFQLHAGNIGVFGGSRQALEPGETRKPVSGFLSRLETTAAWAT